MKDSPWIRKAGFPGILLVILLLAPAEGLSQSFQKEPQEEFLGKVFANPLERNGEYGALFLEWIELLERDPGSPLHEILLLRMNDLRDYFTNIPEELPRLERLLENGMPNGAVEEQLREFLLRASLSLGEGKETERLKLGEGYLQKWWIIGPFGDGCCAIHDDVFPPEEEVRLERECSGIPGRLSWIPVTLKGAGRALNLFNFLRPRTGASFACSRFHLSRDEDAYLLVRIPTSFKLWLDGRMIYDADREEASHPREVRIGLRLRQGNHQLLVKCSTPGRALLSVRVVTPGGKVLPSLEEREGSETWTDYGGMHPLEIPFEGGKEAVVEREGNRPSHPLLRMALSYLLACDGMFEEAVEVLPEDGGGEGSGGPFYHFLRGEILNDADFLPEDLRENLAYMEYQRCLEKDPQFLPALERASAYLQKGERWEEAVRTLESALQLNPGYFPAAFLLAGIFFAQGWEKEALDTLKRIERCHPRFAGTPFLLARYYEAKGNHARAHELYLEAFRRDRSREGLVDKIVEYLKGKGDYEGALNLFGELLQEDPDSTEYLAQMAEIHLLKGDYRAGVKAYEDLLERVPFEERYYEGLGHLHCLAGNREKALNFYRKGLKRNPGNFALRDLVSYLEGNVEDFSAPFTPAVEQLLAGQESIRDPQGAEISTLLDLAVFRVFQDGSYEEVVHQLVKILGERGKEKYSEVRLGDEVLEVRTLRKNGEILEPIKLPGKGNRYTLPGLEKGTIVEMRFRNRIAKVPGIPFCTPTFFFQDPGFDGPFLLTRNVGIFPEKFPLKRTLKNFTGTCTKEEQDGKVVHFLEQREVPHCHPEPLMPEPREILPQCRFFTPDSWSRLSRVFLDDFRGRVKGTPEIKRTALRETEGCEGEGEACRRLYLFVNRWVKQDETSLSAQATLSRRSGDRFLLYMALLKAAGIEFDYARCGAFPGGASFEGSLHSLALPNRILRIRPEGEEAAWIAFPGYPLPFKRIPDPFRGGYAFVVERGGGIFVPLPKGSPEENAVEEDLSLRIDAGGDAHCQFFLLFRGMAGFLLKDQLKGVKEAQRRRFGETFLNRLVSGSRLESIFFPSLDDPEALLRVEGKGTLSGFLRKEGGKEASFKMPFEPLLLETHYASLPARTFPLVIREGLALRDRIRVEWEGILHFLPARDFHAVGKLGTYSLTFRKKEGGLVIERRLTLEGGRVDPGEYENFKRFCRLIDQAESQRVVLRGEG